MNLGPTPENNIGLQVRVKGEYPLFINIYPDRLVIEQSVPADDQKVESEYGWELAMQNRSLTIPRAYLTLFSETYDTLLVTPDRYSHYVGDSNTPDTLCKIQLMEFTIPTDKPEIKDIKHLIKLSNDGDDTDNSLLILVDQEYALSSALTLIDDFINGYGELSIEDVFYGGDTKAWSEYLGEEELELKDIIEDLKESREEELKSSEDAIVDEASIVNHEAVCQLMKEKASQEEDPYSLYN